MTTALPRSISSALRANGKIFLYAFDLIELNGDDLRRDPLEVDDFDVLCDGGVVGRIMKAAAVPVGMSWMWTLAYGYHEDRTPTHGYAATREAAMAAFAKSWRRE